MILRGRHLGLCAFLMIALMVAFSTTVPLYATYHSGLIYTQTWTPAGNPYIIVGNSTVVDGNTLTIQPGCQVVFYDTSGNSARYQLLIEGKLIANGNSSSHITFTSGSGSPSPGDWVSLKFSSSDSGSVLDYCDISYGGYSNASVFFHQGYNYVTISNSTIEHSGTHGIYLNDHYTTYSYPTFSNCTISNNASLGIYAGYGYSYPYISDCTIQNNGSYAIQVWGNSVKEITGNMVISGNGVDAIYVDGDNVYGGTWNNHSVPYIIGGDQTVADGYTLTIEEGSTLKFGSERQMTVNGVLIADGTSSEHITFTSSQTSPTPGYWRYIYFNGSDSGSVLDYCDISYGGSSNGNVYFHQGYNYVTISNCTIEHSGSHGIYLNDHYTTVSYPTITNTVIQDNASYGIYAGYGYSYPYVSDCIVQNNGSYAIRVWGNNVREITGNMVISGNAVDAIYVDGDNVYGGTWLNHDVPYIIGGVQTLANGYTLTIDPGDTLKFGSDVYFTVNGKLLADGDAANHITFTSAQDSATAGYWRHLYFSAADSGCVLDYCDISYGGSSNGNVYFHNGYNYVTISNCTIEHSGSHGIYLNDHYTTVSYPTITNTVIQDNASYGIYAGYGYSYPYISDCIVQNNGSYAIRVWGNNVKEITGNMLISGNGVNAIYVDGDNLYDGTWLNHDVPYIIGGAQTVVNGYTLTIDPGDTLKFGSDVYFTVNGKLLADGDAANHITFTSSQATPTPGYWRHLYFSAADSGCVLDYCDISYGGSSNGNVYFHNGYNYVTISNCTIEHSGSHGIYLNDHYTTRSYPTITNTVIQDNASYGITSHNGYSYPYISDCIVQNNGYYAIRVWGNNVREITGNMVISGNGINAIFVDGDNLSGGTWLNHNVPYVIGGVQTLLNGYTLTIDPGDTLKFGSDVYFTVNGKLLADGDAANHITFTSAQDSATAGYWRNLYFNAADSGCVLDYCDISYGGSSNGNVYFHNGYNYVTISNCIIEHSGSHGIYLYDYNATTSYPTITNTVIQDNASYGITSHSGYSYPYISDCTIQNNGSYPIRVWGNNVREIAGNMVISGNGIDAIYVDGYNLNSGTWLNHSVPYVMGGNCTVLNGNTLTIIPGNTLKFSSAVQLVIDGKLIADGTSDSLITFTAYQDTPTAGYWNDLYFSASDSGSVLDYCNIQYGGSGSVGNVCIHNGPNYALFSNTTIEHSSGYGVYINDYNTSQSYPTFTDCVIRDNGSYGITAHHSYSNPYIVDCTFQNNGSYPILVWSYGVDDITGDIDISGNGVDAIYIMGHNIYSGTWWNHSVPYIMSGNSTLLNGNTLTILPGNTLKFSSAVQLVIDGKLIADGTSDSLITFTAYQDTPTAGYWNDLYFSASDSGSVLDYCNIQYGGSGSVGNVCIHGGPNYALFSNTTIEHSSGYGVYINDYNQNRSYPTFTDCVIRENGSHGITAHNAHSNPYIMDCTFQNNGSYPILVWSYGVDDITGDIDISGNGVDAIYVIGNNIYSGTWWNHSVPYIMSGNSTLINGNTLTIIPGNTFKFASSVYLSIDGRLIADGTQDSIITFTANQDTAEPGDWSYLYLSGTDAGTILDHCLVEYGGSSDCNIKIRSTGSNVTVSNSTISNSASSGIYVDDYNVSQSHPTITGNTIEDNASYGIRTRSSGQLTLSDNLIQNNTTGFYSYSNTHYFQYNNQIINNTNYGIYLSGNTNVVFGDALSEWNDIYGNGLYNFYNGTHAVSAEVVYWGSTDSSTIAGTIYDYYDDYGLGIVDFSPWTNAPHDTLFPVMPPDGPVVVITLSCDSTGCDSVFLAWDPIPGAAYYLVYYSDDLGGSFQLDVSGTFSGASWAAPYVDPKRFYYVTANN